MHGVSRWFIFTAFVANFQVSFVITMLFSYLVKISYVLNSMSDGEIINLMHCTSTSNNFILILFPWFGPFQYIIYLSRVAGKSRQHMRTAKVRASLRIRAVSPETMLFTNVSGRISGEPAKWTRDMASPRGWGCALKGWFDRNVLRVFCLFVCFFVFCCCFFFPRDATHFIFRISKYIISVPISLN